MLKLGFLFLSGKIGKLRFFFTPEKRSSSFVLALWSNLGFRSFPNPLNYGTFFHIKSIVFVTIIVTILFIIIKWYNISMNEAYRYKLKLEAVREYRLCQAKQEGRERRRKEKEERTSRYLFNLPNNIPKLANKSDK